MHIARASGFLIFGASAALGCSCFFSLECVQAGDPAHAVFVGRVARVKDGGGLGGADFLSRRSVRFEVKEEFGGLERGVKEVDVFTGRGGGDCGIPFQPGATYLVDAFRTKDNSLYAGICGKTRRIEAAGAGLLVLRQQQSGQTVPSLTGRMLEVEHVHRGFASLDGTRPLTNVLLRLQARGKQYEARSDKQGVYAFYGLPEGQYELALDLPPGLRIAFVTGVPKPGAPIEIRRNGCQDRDIEVSASAAP